MLFRSLQTLINAGIEDIMVVTGGNDAGDFLRLLGNGREYGLQDISYTYQEGHGGIAAALALAENFADGEKICVILGDNIIQGNIRQAVTKFSHQPNGAKILLKEVPDPERFGVAVFEGDRLVRIEEKPKSPASHYAVIGIYLYDNHVFDTIRTLTPSARDEMEVTDLNNSYIEKGTMTSEVLEGWWTDAGTFGSLRRATNLVAETGANLIHLPAQDGN